MPDPKEPKPHDRFARRVPTPAMGSPAGSNVPRGEFDGPEAPTGVGTPAEIVERVVRRIERKTDGSTISIQSQLTEHAADIARIETNFTDRLDKHEEKIDKTNDKIDELASTMSDVRGDLGVATGQLQMIPRALDELAAATKAMREQEQLAAQRKHVSFLAGIEVQKTEQIAGIDVDKHEKLTELEIQKRAATAKIDVDKREKLEKAVRLNKVIAVIATVLAIILAILHLLTSSKSD